MGKYLPVVKLKAEPYQGCRVAAKCWCLEKDLMWGVLTLQKYIGREKDTE